MPESGEFISLSDRERIFGDFASLEVFLSHFFLKKVAKPLTAIK